MKTLKFLPLIACGLLVSCATNNPLTRIEKHPAKFEHLPENQKALSQDGRIEKGMHKDGVFIALGNPDKVVSILEDGQTFEDWNYYSLAPVYVQRFGFSFGHSYGYGRRGYRNGCGRFGYRDGFLYAPSVRYVPRLSAVVRFRDDYVEGYKLNRSN